MSIHIYGISYIDIIKEPHTDKMYLKYHSMFSMFNTYATQAWVFGRECQFSIFWLMSTSKWMSLAFGHKINET